MQAREKPDHQASAEYMTHDIYRALNQSSADAKRVVFGWWEVLKAKETGNVRYAASMRLCVKSAAARLIGGAA